MYCIKCGTKLNPEDKFCYKCGTKVVPVTVPVPGNESEQVVTKVEEVKADTGKPETSDRQALPLRRQDDTVTSLVAKFMQDQDPEAFEKIYQTESAKVYARARMMMGKDADAQDILQDVFLSVYTKIAGLKSPGAFEGWLMTLTRNACLNQLHKNGRVTQFAIAEDGTSYQEEELENPYLDFQPETTMEQKELAENLKQIMDTLPATQSICLQMREYDGLSYQEIADELSIPLSQVKNNIFHAKKKVKAEVIARKLYAAAPLAFFLWMLRQSTEVYACEASVTDAVWIGISSQTGSVAASGEPGGPASDPSAAGDTPFTPQESDVAAPASEPAPVTEAAPASEAAPVTEAAPVFEAAPVSRAATASKAAPASKFAGMSLGTKNLIAVVAAVLLIGTGAVATLGVMKIVNQDTNPAQLESESNDSEAADNAADTADDFATGADGSDQAAIAADSNQEQTDDDSEDEEAFVEPIDYWDKLTEDQRVRLYCLLCAIYDEQEANNHKTTTHNQTSGRQYSDPLAESTEDLAEITYSIMISPGFRKDFRYEQEYEGTYFDGSTYILDTYVGSKEDVDNLLKNTVDLTIMNPEGVVREGNTNLQYENNEYLAPVLDDWVNGCAGLLKIEQTGADEVMIYGVTGTGNEHFVCEEDYDPHKWHYYENEIDDYMTLKHSYSAKARINPDSPCGLTIMGIVYDDPESAAVAKEAGFDSADFGSGIEDSSVEDAEKTYFLLPNSNREPLKESDISDMTAQQLRLARNEIYARHGRKFQDEELQAYFDSQPWYAGFIEPEDFNENVLNDIERENAETLKKEEAKKK